MKKRKEMTDWQMIKLFLVMFLMFVGCICGDWITGAAVLMLMKMLVD